jgi:hypothetical protein
MIAKRLIVAEVVEISRRHPITVYRDLESGALHGTQSMKGGRWLVREECLDAFLDGDLCEHQGPHPHLRVVGAPARKRGV